MEMVAPCQLNIWAAQLEAKSFSKPKLHPPEMLLVGLGKMFDTTVINSQLIPVHLKRR
jgi:hypothetical protein